ncbi:MAG: sigma-70 family RNA polymerase sigma factor [Acidobacteriota bacterium]
MYNDYNDEELIQLMLPNSGLASADIEAAWQEFIRRFDKLLLKTIYSTYRRYMGQRSPAPEDVSDMVQQVFVKITEHDYRVLRTLKFHKKDSLRLYLYVIAISTVLDCLRNSPAQSISHSLNEPYYQGEKVLPVSELLYYAGRNPEEEYLDKELLERVLAVVERESDQESRNRNRDIFLMAYRDGYTRSEIAEKTVGITRAGINSFLHRVNKVLIAEFPLEEQHWV